MPVVWIELARASLRSASSTRSPRRASSRAHCKPASPAPMMVTSYFSMCFAPLDLKSSLLVKQTVFVADDQVGDAFAFADRESWIPDASRQIENNGGGITVARP